MRCLARSCGAAAMVMGALLMFVSAAEAQSGSMTWGFVDANSFRPDISARDLKVIIRVLELPAESQKALQDLYDGYAGTLTTEGGTVREFLTAEIEKAEAMNDGTMLTTAQGKMREWSTRSQQIKKSFLEDLKSLLSREEEARWPLAERELRRFKEMGGGRLSGESVDLVRLAETHGGEPAAGSELANVLGRYREEIDRALTARKEALGIGEAAYKDAGEDYVKRGVAWDAVHKARVAVQGVNDRYAKLIAAQLAEEKRAAFGQAYFEESFRAVCKPSRTEEYMKDALAVKTLTPEQRARLTAIQLDYDRRRMVVLRTMADGWRQYEEAARPSADRKQEEGIRSGQAYNGAWLGDKHPLVAGRKERFEMDKDVRAKIDAVLTREQREDVPSRLTEYARFEQWDVGAL